MSITDLLLMSYRTMSLLFLMGKIRQIFVLIWRQNWKECQVWICRRGLLLSKESSPLGVFMWFAWQHWDPILFAGFNRAVMEGTNANDYGASIKSKYKHNVGDFIMFADDDNWYEPDALDTVRTVVQHDLDALYVFQYRHTTVAPDLPGHFIPDLERNGEVEVGNIDTGTRP